MASRYASAAPGPRATGPAEARMPPVRGHPHHLPAGAPEHFWPRAGDRRGGKPDPDRAGVLWYFGAHVSRFHGLAHRAPDTRHPPIENPAARRPPRSGVHLDIHAVSATNANLLAEIHSVDQ